MVAAIRFESVSKRFTMTTERPQTLLETVISVLKGQRLNRRRGEELWAVHNLDFELAPGECLGIVGRNGSGKSTVLKLIARILRPTSGRVVVRGRTSALLELGAGFHPDLTGRENIYLNASVLGLDQKEVDRHFQSIVDFSELESFIDVPVKHYSSGMYMRLGFSVAIHVEPDILLVDEILAVGDQAFQRKCIEQINALKRQGTTIILVSHNLDMVRNLCTRLLWVESGRLRAEGSVSAVAGQYMAASYDQYPRLNGNLQDGPFERWGSGEIVITDVRFLNEDGEETNQFRTNEPMTIEMDYWAREPIEEPEFGFAIHRQDGVHVNGPNSRAGGLSTGRVHGTGTIRYHVEHLPLLPARYYLTAAIHDSRLPRAYDHHEQAYAFRIVPGGTAELHGLVTLPAAWTWEPSVEPSPTLTNTAHKR